MEDTVEQLIRKTCDTHGLKYVSQGGIRKTKEELDYDVQVDIRDHVFEFAIKGDNKILFINFSEKTPSSKNEVSREWMNRLF